MSRLIGSLGYTVLSAGSIAEALQQAQAQPVDLLISDLNLPDGTGHELVGKFREIRPDTRAIALSGYDDADDIRQSREAGFSQHLRKPIELATLEKAIKTALNGRS